MTEATQRRRAETFKARALKQQRTIYALTQQLKAQHPRSFAQGSGAMMAAVHDALNDADLSLWISQKLLAQRTRRPPFKLSPEKERMVRTEVAAILKKCGVKSNVSEIKL